MITFKIFAVLVFFVGVGSNMASAQCTLILKDRISGQPVENAGFHVGSQKGRSAKNGVIVFLADTMNTLFITHISYEAAVLSPHEVASAVKTGWIALNPSASIYLNPVTVYAIKGRSVSETVELNNNDRLQHDAGAVLQQIPGFSAIRKSGTYGADPVFRGFKLSQLNILQDGALTSIAACPNRMDPPTSQVLISQMQQIEVLKGPHSFRYGPVVGAVIHFKSQPAEFRDTPQVFGRISGGYESNGEVYRVEGITGFRSKNIQVAVSGSYSDGHNYKDGNDSIMPAKFERGSVSLRMDARCRPNQLVTFTITRNFSRNTSFPTLMMDLLTDDTWLMQGQNHIVSENSWFAEWNTQAYVSFVDHTMGNECRPAYATTQAATGATTNTKGGRTEFLILKNRSKIYLGADIKYETVDGDRTRKMMTGSMAGKTFTDTVWQNSYMTRGGLFAEWQHPLSQCKLVVSGRLDVTHAEARNPSAAFLNQNRGNGNTDLNTSVSAGITRQWHNHWQAGIWLGRGIRSANLTERYINSLPIGIDPYEMLGNPQLKPEANNQLDVSMGFISPATVIQSNGFASIITHYISSVIDPQIAPRYGAPGVRRYINVDNAQLYGVEGSWLQQWLPVLRQHVTVGYTYGKNTATGYPLPEIAPLDLRLRLEAIFFKARFIPYLQGRYAARQNRIATDYGETSTAAFKTFEAGLQLYGIKGMQVSMAVNNIFNEAYREHLSRMIRPTLPLNAVGRSIIIFLSYEIK